MRKLLIVFFLLLHFFASQAQDTGIKNNRIFKFPQGITSNDYIPGRIILKFKAGVESSSKSFSLRIPVHTDLTLATDMLLRVLIVANEKNEAGLAEQIDRLVTDFGRAAAPGATAEA